MEKPTVLILAAGDSGRLWPINGKYNLKFFGKPLSYFQLVQLQKFGFSDLVIVVNKDNETFFSNLKTEFPKLNISIAQQNTINGMAGAVVSAKNYISGKSLLVLNQSDIVEDIIFADFGKILSLNPDGIIAGTTMDAYFPGGYLTVKDHNVSSIVEKPAPNARPSKIVKFVFDYFQNADLFLKAIEQVKISSDDKYERALDLLFKGGLAFKFLPYKGFWGHLKYPWHILNISQNYLSKIEGKRGKNLKIAESAIILGKVCIEDDVKILENAKITGPAFIGRGTIIGNNAIVRESMIGASCVVGFSTEIARSFVGDNCWFHTNYVGDSVLSDNISMGAGTVIANYKLNEGTIKSVVYDQKIDTGKIKLGSMIGANVRIGINASVMPGVKIGKNCFVGPAVLLDKDLPDGKSCQLVSSSYKIKENKIVLAKESRRLILENLKVG